MPVTIHSWYLVPQGQSRISRARFGQLGRQRFAPAVLAERSPEDYYDTIMHTTVLLDGKPYQCDALFILEMFGHESTYGKAGAAVSTRSWGNTRLPSIGVEPAKNADGSVKTVPGLTGVFPVYNSWRDGCIATCARLLNHVYFDWGRRMIESIFRYPPNPTMVWAPAGDHNDPDGYLNTVVREMNRDGDLIDAGSGGGGPTPVTRTKLLISAGHWDSNGDAWNGIEHARTRPLAEEIAHLAYAEGFDVFLQPAAGEGNFNGGYREVAAWAARMQAQHGIQMLFQVHHQGVGNATSAGAFEIHPNAPERDGDYDDLARQIGLKVVQNMHDRGVMQRWTDGQMEEGETNAGRLAWFSYSSHLKASCERLLVEYSHCNSNPRDRAIVDSPGWYQKAARATVDAFIEFYGKQPARDVQPQPEPQPEVPPKLILPGENPADPDGKKGIGFVLGFRDFMLAQGAAKYPQDPALGALSIFGHPLEDEWEDVHGDAWQRCEKYILHWQRDQTDNLPWNIVGHHVGEVGPLPEPKKKPKG